MIESNDAVKVVETIANNLISIANNKQNFVSEAPLGIVADYYFLMGIIALILCTAVAFRVEERVYIYTCSHYAFKNNRNASCCELH
jgi:hypothetical protein